MTESSADAKQAPADAPPSPSQAPTTVETVPHGAETTAAHAPSTPSHQVAAAVAVAVERRHDRLTIELAPADLGRIEVALRTDAEGRLHASIAADRPETLQLLERDARGLEQMLSASGLQLAGGGLSLGLRRDGGGGQGGGEAGGGRGDRAATTAGSSRRAEAGPAGAVRRRIDRLLDLSV